MGKYHDRINWKKELRLLPGYIIVCAWVALTAAILFWIVCASLSSTKEILTGRVVDFSNGLKWDNYVTAWNTQNVSLYFFNSLVYAIVSCVGVLLISAPGAYVLSRWKFVGGKAIRIGLVIAMSVPTIMIIMPLYSLAVQWGIKGRVLLVVLYIMLRVPYTAIYLLDFFSSLSRSYEEAAYIDGCSHSLDVLADYAAAGSARHYYGYDFQLYVCVERVLHGVDFHYQRFYDPCWCRFVADCQRNEIFRPVRCYVCRSHHCVPAYFPAVSFPV